MNRTTLRVFATAVAGMTLGMAPSALACGNKFKSNASIANFAIERLMAMPGGVPRPAAVSPSPQAADNSPKIVGMWEVQQWVGNALYDHDFQQFSSDGLEVQNSGFYPPLVGNMCYGVWTQVDSRTFKLKHFGWLFDTNSNFIGKFIMTATMTITPQSADTYTGTFSADTYLPNGQIDPTLHVDGTMSAIRLTVN